MKTVNEMLFNHEELNKIYFLHDKEECLKMANKVMWRASQGGEWVDMPEFGFGGQMNCHREKDGTFIYEVKGRFEDSPITYFVNLYEKTVLAYDLTEDNKYGGYRAYL